MDLIIAFLNGNIDEEILMEISEGFPGTGDESKIFRINEAFYGQNQSPKAWYDHISTWLHKQGLIRSESDSNLYYLKRNEKLTILLLYVDDLLIIGDDQEDILKLKQNLQQEFEMTDLGEACDYLGVEIHRQGCDGIFLNQKGI